MLVDVLKYPGWPFVIAALKRVPAWPLLQNRVSQWVVEHGPKVNLDDVNNITRAIAPPSRDWVTNTIEFHSKINDEFNDVSVDFDVDMMDMLLSAVEHAPSVLHLAAHESAKQQAAAYLLRFRAVERSRFDAILSHPAADRLVGLAGRIYGEEFWLEASREMEMEIFMSVMSGARPREGTSLQRLEQDLAWIRRLRPLRSLDSTSEDDDT
jgi:hypothetical protein